MEEYPLRKRICRRLSNIPDADEKCFTVCMLSRRVCSASALKKEMALRSSTQDMQQDEKKMPVLSINECVALMKSCKSLAEAEDVHARVLSNPQHIPRSGVYLSNLLIEMYGKCASVEHARRVFDGISPKNSFSWALMLSAYAQNGHLDEAKKIFGVMPERNMVSWTAMLVAYALKGHLDEAKWLFDGMPERNLVSWTAMLAGYAQNGHLEEAKRVFDLMPERNVISWNAMLSANSQNGHLEGAKTVFDCIPQRDVVSWNAILAAYAQSGYLEEAEKVFDGMPEWNLLSWTAMLTVYAEKGHLQKVKNTLNGMPERNLISWTVMLVAYAQNGHLEEARDVFDKMPERSLVSWTAMLSAYTQKGHLEEAKAVFDDMPDQDLISWTAMLAAYAQNGHLEEAKKLFDEIPERDVISWNAMTAAYSQNGHPEEALELFLAMKMEGVKPNEISFVCILLGCIHGGNLHAGWCCFHSMIMDFGLRPTKEHYSCMIDLLGRAGHLPDAEDLIANMPFVPDDLDWQCFLGACRSHNDIQGAARAANHALDLKPKNAAPYLLLANMYSGNGNDEDAHKAMKQKSLPGDESQQQVKEIHAELQQLSMLLEEAG